MLFKRHELATFIHYQHDDQHPYHTNGQRLSPYFADPLRKLDTLYRTLHNSGTALVATAVHGMGGAGKTQLALKYSEAFRDEYDGVWWFRSEDVLQLEEDCQELCAEASTLCNMGDNKGAKALEEQVLERRKEVLGPKHPDTTIAARNLFTDLEKLNNSKYCQAVIDEHLLWLLADGVELHSAYQRQVRDMLRLPSLDGRGSRGG